jgi:hypothetical protein
MPPAPPGREKQQVNLRFDGPEGRSFIIEINITGISRKSLIAELKVLHNHKSSLLQPNSVAFSFAGFALRLRAERLPHAVLVSFPDSYFSEEEFEKELALTRQTNPPPPLRLWE